MTAAILTRLPLEAGGAVLATTGRAVHSAISWGFAHYMRAPLASTAIATMVTLSLVATSNALYFQHTRHPSPLFVAGDAGTIDPSVAPVVPAPRPVTKKAAATVKAVLPKVETTGSVSSNDRPIGNAEVFELQRKLESMKLFSGTVDGYYGPKTAGAIRAFETKMGMKPLGELTPEIIKTILAAPLLAPQPEPRTIKAPEPLPSADPLPKVTMTEPVVVTMPAAQLKPVVEIVPLPTPDPLPAAVTARVEMQPVAPSKPLTRELPETPQEAMNIAVETAGDAIDTILEGVQTMVMTTPNRAPAPRAAAVPAPLQFGPDTAQAPAPEPIVTASVAAVTVASPQAAAATEIAVKPRPVPVLDTDAKVEDLMPPFSVTDPVIVSRVQRGLASLGFLHGPIDGVAGEATAKAIRTFETFYNYQRTGRITPELPDLLVKAGATL
jgi:peptidoglycan hydrolase-like protein with peptidoglycan-binding domain